ncbi:MAG: GAF domain-containing protein [Elusimicrobia bacterium]|nr:GAF domain-containing protein [Elusimicrobiota bacterium]
MFLLILLCVALILALAWSLKELYALKKKSPYSTSSSSAASADSGGWKKLDELLTTLLGLHEMGMTVTGNISQEQFCKAVLENAMRLMNSNRASVMILDPKTNELKILASKGLSGSVVESFRLKPGEGVAGKAFESGESIFIENPNKDTRYTPHGSSSESQEPFISIPLRVKNKSVGVLNLHSTSETEPFNDYNLKFLTILAGEAAITLENLDLFDSLQTFYLDLVQTLARAIDSKDSYTHDHADRARQKARRIAQELKLPEQMIRYIEYAALLHDVGKIGIADSILLKPGKLTAEEYEEMKKHPAIGHQILAPVKSLGPVAQMVLYHQEWFNGQGYPDGLKGEEIPLGARIVATIDAWDAMTSDRPYRKALSREKAISELKKGAGTQFDPKVVDIFLRVEEKEWKGETDADHHPDPAGQPQRHHA